MGGRFSVEEGLRVENGLASKTCLNRLIHKNAVSDVKRCGRKVVTDHFVLFLLANKSKDLNYAIHIRKRFGNAVERNRAKRVFRASLRQLSELFFGLDMIITPRRGVKGFGSFDVARLLKECCYKTGISKRR